MENPDFPFIRAVAAGEALIDLVRQPDGRYAAHAGGAVYNLARALALQGVGTTYLNALSRDRFGRELGRALHEAGVALAYAQPVDEPTSLALVALDADGKPEYTFHREGVADRAGNASQLIEATRALRDIQLACTGCLALLPEDRARYLPWLQDCRSRGVLVAVDANLRPAVARDEAAYRASVRAALGLADIIKVSDDDLALLYPHLEDPLEAAAELFALGPACLVALTRGAAGAALVTRDGRYLHAVEREPLTVADTVGAGDCFFAGLLAGLLERGGAADTPTLRAALARGMACASLDVQRPGCMPPTAQEVAQWLARGSVRIASDARA
ncbi:MAG: carbohydrate kinase [Burkholderiales bacterium]|nr:carbohydrate kinase [Burkholderiales bacterium]